ncbi:MAG: sigma-54-dependent Fis family transcriptional regulator [Halobacteriovoraceae bacterium]|nr:sigma-54-dependent Fis family transcriptional regulator [Halobacteriovoraceae bacterium]
MKRILISWIAFNNDFVEENGARVVNTEGPTVSFHQNFFDEKYDRHILLSSAKGEDTRMEFLLNYLSQAFPRHQIEPCYMGVSDVIDLEQINSKVQPLLFEYRDRPIDIFISPGTPTMQVAWYLAHWSLGLNTRLLQVRGGRHTKSRKPELEYVDIEKDVTTSSAIIRQSKTDTLLGRSEEGFLETESISPLYDIASKVAQAANATVLILGETGTGKEHLAQYIHKQSPRRDAPFFPVNCSAMSGQLLESRLFGYQKGAFTGAEQDTIGIIESAEGGTVFLDEIGDISSYMQQSLLRVFQEKEITPIGGKPRKVDVRFIGATNKDLLALCEAGKFRWDLYYRLSVVELELPSLQERGIEEIKALIQFFIKQKKKLFNAAKPLRLSQEVKDKLLSYPFPGNIRELENLIERLYVLNTDGEARLQDLPPRILAPRPKDSLLLADIEKWHIERVLQLNGGIQRKTARDIGVAYNTLMKKVGDYGIDLEGFKS